MKTVLLSFVAAFAAIGCGGSDPGPSGMDAQAASDLASGATPDMAQSAPGIPVLAAIGGTTHGSFELAWTNPASGCDMIVIERKKNTAAYAVRTTLSGTATDYNDTDHNAGTFCYHLICKLGGVASDPSNEQCKTQ